MSFLFECSDSRLLVKPIIKESKNDANTTKKNDRNIEQNGIPPISHLFRRKGKTPYATFLAKGSVALEASLVMPLVIFAWMTLIQLMTMINIQNRIQGALYNQSMKAAGYTYFTNYVENYLIDGMESEEILMAENIARNGITELVIEHMVKTELGDDFFKNGYITDGKNGIKVVITPWVDREMMDIILEYKIKPRFNLFGTHDIPVVARARLREWNGVSRFTKKEKPKDEESGQQVVYITPSGSVYHVNRNCTYLKINITTVKYEDVDSLRNVSGSKYYMCEACMLPMNGGETVYITKYGNRFHTDKTCNKIYHNIIEKKLDEVEDRRPCSKCRE